MEDIRRFRLGFLYFTEDEKGVSLHRTGVYLAGSRSVHSGRALGFHQIRIGKKCFSTQDLKPETVKEESSSVTLTWSAPDHSFSVRTVFTLDAENAIISRKDTLVNTSGTELEILRFNARMSFTSADYEIYTQQSRWGLENQGQWTPLNAGAVELNARRGRWTEGGTPFAAIRSSEGSRALAFHLIPNGDYCMRFSLPAYSTYKPALTLETGLEEEQLSYVLDPGEEMTSPELLIQELPDREVYSGTASLHRYANKNFVGEERSLPVVYNTWLDKMTVLEVPRLRRQLAAAKKAGCEVFVIDAGWYVAKGDWSELENTAFCGEMLAFAGEVHGCGMKFGIWVEPEFFQGNTPVQKAHPEWFECTEGGGAMERMTYQTEEAKEYYYNMFADLIRKYSLDYIKIDMNTSPGPDSTGRVLTHYVRSIREVMARLRKDFPGTVLENCSSGAMRTTLGELPYFDQHFISDNGNVLDVLHITQGLMLRFPPGRVLRWLVIASGGYNELWGFNKEETVLQVQNATWKHYEETDLECGLLASMTGVMGFSGDLASFKEETLAKIRTYTDYYTANRASFQRSLCTLLTSPEPIHHRHGVIAFQLTDPVKDKHFVFAFYRDCDGMTGTVLPLKELCSGKKYSVRKVFGGTARDQNGTVTGRELAGEGLELSFVTEQHGDFKGCLWEIAPE